MPDWSKSMQQTFEYYVVNPDTWRDTERIDNVISCTITRDSDAETLGSATIDIADSIGECYVRVYLVTIQNGVREKHPLGTYLVQTPSSSFDGKTRSISMDTYTPLLELKEGMPPLGYYVPKDTNIMDMAYRLVRENARAPVVEAKCDITLSYDFVADPSDTWLTFLTDLIANAKYTFSMDEMGRILFAPHQTTASLQPLADFDDGNSSILYPELSLDHDLYGIPNAVEVVYSESNEYFYSKVVNDDPNSPISTVNRGREILHRVSNPDLLGEPSQSRIDEYATQLLRELSALEYTLTYSHGFYPVRLGDCVRLNYEKADITNIKAKIISQTIKCDPGCPVSETAVYTNQLWR